jgi:hypothetical protein
MAVFLLSFLVVCLAVLGMAVGALMGRPPLAGGCGGPEGADPTGTRCAVCAGRRRHDRHLGNATRIREADRSQYQEFG